MDTATARRTSDLQEFVEAVRARTPIEDTLKSAGVLVRREGQRLRAKCPLHEDTQPSLVVFPADARGPERWRCFGSCQRGGDVFELLLLLHNRRSRWEAIVARAAELGLAVPSLNGRPPHPRTPSPIEDILAVAQRIYAQRLNPDVLAYLASRALPEGTVRAWGIGYAPPGEHLLVATALTPGQHRLAEKMGLLHVAGDYFGTRFGGGWIVFPNRRDNGRRVLDLQGRAWPEAGHKPKWLTRPGPIRFLFNEDAARARRVLLCEGVIDGLTAAAAGYDAVAVYGQGGFKSEWARRFARTDTVYVCFDRDANDRAVQVASLFGERGRIVLLPPDLGPKGDLNNLRVHASSIGRFRQELDHLLRQAPLPLEVAVARLQVQPLITLRERMTPLLRQISDWPDPIVRDHLTRLLANRCGLTLEVVRRTMRDAAGAAPEEGQR